MLDEEQVRRAQKRAIPWTLVGPRLTVISAWASAFEIIIALFYLGFGIDFLQRQFEKQKPSPNFFLDAYGDLLKGFPPWNVINRSVILVVTFVASVVQHPKPKNIPHRLKTYLILPMLIWIPIGLAASVVMLVVIMANTGPVHWFAPIYTMAFDAFCWEIMFKLYRYRKFQTYVENLWSDDGPETTVSPLNRLLTSNLWQEFESLEKFQED